MVTGSLIFASAFIYEFALFGIRDLRPKSVATIVDLWLFNVIINVAVAGFLYAWITESNLAKNQKSCAIWEICSAVGSWLANEISEIDTFAIQISRLRCFRRSYPHPLRENTDKVTESRAVPEKLVVSKILWIKSVGFAFSIDIKAVNQFYVLIIFGVINILFDHFVIFRRLFKRLHLTF